MNESFSADLNRKNAIEAFKERYPETLDDLSKINDIKLTEEEELLVEEANNREFSYIFIRKDGDKYIYYCNPTSLTSNFDPSFFFSSNTPLYDGKGVNYIKWQDTAIDENTGREIEGYLEESLMAIVDDGNIHHILPF